MLTRTLDCVLVVAGAGLLLALVVFARRHRGAAKLLKKTNYTLGWHLVAFLDVLGQTERFQHLQLPKTSQDRERVAAVLKDTAGFVSNLRILFRKNFERFQAGISEGKSGISDFRRPRVFTFADSFVASVPLRNDGGDVIPVSGILSALIAASSLMLTSLASKHAVRGGIDVGLATEVGPEEIYGTALARAYHLESEQALYPRILIGEDFWKYISAALVEFERNTKPTYTGAKAIVQKITQLVATDDDGAKILDYLGPVVRGLMKPGEESILVQPAYDFVVGEHERFSSEGDNKHVVRYQLLRRYFESRLVEWGLTVVKS